MKITTSKDLYSTIVLISAANDYDSEAEFYGPETISRFLTATKHFVTTKKKGSVILVVLEEPVYPNILKGNQESPLKKQFKSWLISYGYACAIDHDDKMRLDHTDYPRFVVFMKERKSQSMAIATNSMVGFLKKQTVCPNVCIITNDYLFEDVQKTWRPYKEFSVELLDSGNDGGEEVFNEATRKAEYLLRKVLPIVETIKAFKKALV